MDQNRTYCSDSALSCSSASSLVTGERLYYIVALSESRPTFGVGGDWLRRGGGAAPPITSESSSRTRASPCTMSTRVDGSEARLSQSTGISVQRMRVAWSETFSAIAVPELERRAPLFLTGKVVFTHELHCKVTKRHPHVENFSIAA